MVIGGVSLQGGIGRLSGVFAERTSLEQHSTVAYLHRGHESFYMNIIRSALIRGRNPRYRH